VITLRNGRNDVVGAVRAVAVCYGRCGGPSETSRCGSVVRVAGFVAVFTIIVILLRACSKAFEFAEIAWWQHCNADNLMMLLYQYVRVWWLNKCVTFRTGILSHCWESCNKFSGLLFAAPFSAWYTTVSEKHPSECSSSRLLQLAEISVAIACSTK